MRGLIQEGINMFRSKTILFVILVGFIAACWATPAAAQNITGLWHCYGHEVGGGLQADFNWTLFRAINQELYARLNIPDLGLIDTVVPAAFDGQNLTIFVQPGVFHISGVYDGE